ncbi:MAG: MFS transporter [Firmicutes bacterium]|nr:MFS transporter [Bacillota bacterium]
MEAGARLSAKAKKRLALHFILLFGLISALGDITYEGARSIYGPYLGYLGAGAAAIGFVSGLGEFLGYFFRLVSGYFIDRTGKHWLVTILGYGMLVSVPLLAVAGKWEVAALFIILERLGKAIRSPGRDAMLSHATKQLGAGFGFGLHEALDQVGGIIGPLILTAVLALTGEYKKGFTALWVPAILTVVFTLIARGKVPNPAVLEDSPEEAREGASLDKSLSKKFWLYVTFIFISVSGFVNFPIISYHFSVREVIAEARIPALYAVAMTLDAAVALIIGKTYDKIGLASLAAIPLLTLPTAFLGFSENHTCAVIAVILWGSVMGIHETIMRAAIADLTPIEKRGTAYGIFNTLYGIAMLTGSVAMGFLYEYSASYVIGFVVITEVIALIILGASFRSGSGNSGLRSGWPAR